MDNSRIIKATIAFKSKLKQEIEKDEHSGDMKFWLWKTLIMAEIAHRSFELNVPIQNFEKYYFDRYTAVARHFRDWAMDWVADNYFEISHYVGTFYWPDTNNHYFKDYIPFKVFDL